MTISHAAIVGAGISGLTAALALARHGISSEIFEQADALAEVGAGLQISPNASRCLAKIGVLGRLEGQWREPKKVALASGLTLRELAHVPVGEARKRWGAPYGTLHRATLQSALKHAVADEPLATLRLGARIDKAKSIPSTRTCRTTFPLIILEVMNFLGRRQITTTRWRWWWIRF